MQPSKSHTNPSPSRPAMLFCAGFLVLTTLTGVVAAVGGSGPRQAAASSTVASQMAEAAPASATEISR